MRIPVAVDLQSRDGTLAKDSKIVNALIEVDGDNTKIRKRPGSTDRAIVQAGTALLLFPYSTYVVSVIATGSGVNCVKGGVITAGAYSNTFNGSFAAAPTVQCYAATNDSNSAARAMIIIPGVSGGNNVYSISGTSVAIVTTGSGTNREWTTVAVPGAVFIDGYYVGLDVDGALWSSDVDDITRWRATSFIRAQKGDGKAVALAKSQSYIVVFKQFSTELFYNAGNPSPGSPFSSVESGFTQIGLASGNGFAYIEKLLVFIGQSRQKGRGVYLMEGLSQQKISTPDVDRVLNADDLATVYVFGLKIGGHRLCVITLVTSDLTIAYDMDSQRWIQLTSLTLGADIGGTETLTRSGDVATYTSTNAHGMADGDAVLMAGATQTEYNGIKQITKISANSFSYTVTGSPATPATGTLVVKPYTESRFKYVKYANFDNRDLLLHETDGHLYEMLQTEYQDADIPISVLTRTPKLDGKTIDPKLMGSISVIGDKVSSTIMVRYSDDDMGTSRPYRPVNLNLKNPRIRRTGAFERRIIETRHIEDVPLTLEALELEIST